MQIGDKVQYIPDECHALQRGPGGFPWNFGWKTGKRLGGGKGDEVVPLTQDEAMLKLRHIKKQAPDRAASERDKLVLLTPNGSWEAIIKAIHGEGEELTADLDIKDPTTGATLHYDEVPLDETKSLAHSFHAA
jgi:hypothetical protein